MNPPVPPVPTASRGTPSPTRRPAPAIGSASSPTELPATKLAARGRFRASRMLPLTTALTAAFFTSYPAHAVAITQANHINDRNPTTSWVGGAVPTSADIALLDSTFHPSNS